MRGLYDLLIMYHDINTKVIELDPTTARSFKAFTELLTKIIDILDAIMIDFDQKQVKEIQSSTQVATDIFKKDDISLWKYFEYHQAVSSSDTGQKPLPLLNGIPIIKTDQIAR